MRCGTSYVDLTHQTSQLDPEKVDCCGNILHSRRRSESQSENAAREKMRGEKRKLSTPELTLKDAYAFSSVLQCRVCCIVAFLFFFFSFLQCLLTTICHKIARACQRVETAQVNVKPVCWSGL